jgi:universal stress protein A
MKNSKAKTTSRPAGESLNPRPKRILVPLDFSDPSKRAMRLAGDWAELFGAHVYLLHVVEMVPFMSGLEEVPIALTRRDVAQTAKNSLAALARLQLPKTVKVSVLVYHGKAFNQIVTAARSLQIDLIIIATHGYTGLDKMLLGSTAERVVRHAPCPVLTVRQRQG